MNESEAPTENHNKLDVPQEEIRDHRMAYRYEHPTQKGQNTSPYRRQYALDTNDSRQTTKHSLQDKTGQARTNSTKTKHIKKDKLQNDNTNKNPVRIVGRGGIEERLVNQTVELI